MGYEGFEEKLHYGTDIFLTNTGESMTAISIADCHPFLSNNFSNSAT